MTLILLLGFASVLAIFLHALEQTDRLIGRGKTLLSLAPDLTFAATVYVVATTGQWIPLVVDVVSKRLLYGLFRHLLIRLHIRRVIKQVFDQFIKGREVEDGTAVIVKGGERSRRSYCNLSERD